MCIHAISIYTTSVPKSNGNPRKIYLDYASSVSSNPSSIHELGVAAKAKLENARGAVAGFLNARKEEVIFTSGGTEGNNIAIQGVSLAQFFSRCALAAGTLAAKKIKQVPPHIITTNIEHPSVLETCKILENRGMARLTIVPVESNGIVDPKKIRKAINKNTVLISVMYANNEIGTIQPVREIAKEIRHYNKENKKNVLFHTDAVQAANYLDLNVELLGVDLLTLSGSKIEGAGRVGVLYKKKSAELAPVYAGGDQEFGLRPGTENLPEILKFADAFAETRKISEKESKRLIALRDYFFSQLEHSNILKNVGMLINGDKKIRLPNNVSITAPKIPSDLLVIELSARGVMISSKSACKSSRAEGSYVIEALRPGADPEIGGLRFSFGRGTGKKEIDYCLKSLAEILVKLQKWY